jgi:murein DD-endopeptidase MepM/ murein hydrolase activator NlpD
MHRHAGGWSASLERIPWRIEQIRAEGVIHSSLYEAMDSALGEDVLPREGRDQLVWGLAEVYDWVVDFSRDVREGDRFRVVAERLVSLEGEVRYGRVLGARLDIGGRRLYAFRFDEGERPEFYDENGRSLRRALLRAPLEFRRIASGFSRSRFHPILRYYRAHLGIDFGAAYGAPVRSVGDGTVTFASRMGGYGNMVEVRHAGGITSRYAHLSRFATGVEVGERVRQGETIGYVGASGLATSPHLHYELRSNGRAINPRRAFETAPGPPVPASLREAFERERSHLRALLEPEPVRATPQAG